MYSNNRNYYGGEIILSKKRYKHKRLPFCVKAINASFNEQYSKICEEFNELGAENANLSNRLTKNKSIRPIDIEKAFLEAFDVSQSAQTYMHVLINNFGKHNSLTFDKLYTKALTKNANREYYAKDENVFDIADWGDDK